jgi:hypothetical protein
LPHRGPASHDPYATALRTPRSTCVDETDHGPGRPSKGDARSWTIRACPPRSAPGTLVAGSTRREVWSPSRLVGPAEIPLGCHPAKGSTVEEIEVPFAALEPLRERGIAPPCAPGSELCHAASEEALLGSSRAFFAASAVPSTDEESTRTDATVQIMGAEAPGDLAGRCAHHGIYDRISSRADVPRTSWALSLTNQVFAQYKKHPNKAFFLALLPHRVLHSFSPEYGLCPAFSRASSASRRWRAPVRLAM